MPPTLSTLTTPAPLVLPELLAELTALGRSEGLIPGLRAALAAGLPLPFSAFGLSLLPSGVDPPPDCAEVVGASHSAVEGTGLVLVRRSAPRHASQPPAQRTTAVETGPMDAAVLLAAVRLGLTEGLLDLAVEYLTARQVEGAPLIDKQLIQAAIAETTATLELCRHALRTAAAPAVTEALHARLAAAGWTVTTLFGGSGYLRGHPAYSLYVAELVHDAWVAPAAAWE